MDTTSFIQKKNRVVEPDLCCVCLEAVSEAGGLALHRKGTRVTTFLGCCQCRRVATCVSCAPHIMRVYEHRLFLYTAHLLLWKCPLCRAVTVLRSPARKKQMQKLTRKAIHDALRVGDHEAVLALKTE